MTSVRVMTASTLFRSYFRHISTSFPFSHKADSSDLKISQSCVDRLKNIASNDDFLRVTIDGGGCSGFQYQFNLDTQLHEDDECFEKDGAKIVVDKMSLPFIKGSTIDYHEELIRSAFRIVDNPQADTKCSCGASFAVKM